MFKKSILLLFFFILFISTAITFASSDLEDKKESENLSVSWYMVDQNGKVKPKALPLTSTLKKEDFNTIPTKIIKEYKKDGEIIKKEEIPIIESKIERTIEGDISHPGLNVVKENIIYDKTYNQTIYHTIYTFVTVNYYDEQSKEVIHPRNWQTIGYRYRQDTFDNTVEKKWDVSSYDKIEIEGYDYVKTSEKTSGNYNDLTGQKDIYVWYKKQEKTTQDTTVEQEKKEDTPPVLVEKEDKKYDISREENSQEQNNINKKRIKKKGVVLKEKKKDKTKRKKNEKQEKKKIKKEKIKKEKKKTKTPVKVNNNNNNNNNDKDIEEKIVSNAVPKTTPKGTWALLNLIALIFTFLIWIIFFFSKDAKEKEDTILRKRKILYFITTFIFIVSLIFFLVTEDIFLKMEIYDKWTLLIWLLTFLQLFLYKKRYKEEDFEKEE